MVIALMVITDGRGALLEQTIESVKQNLIGDVGCTIINDSGDAEYASWLDRTYPEFHRVHHEERRGLGGAVRSAWTEARALNAEFEWHQEDDFVINEPVSLGHMAALLRSNRDLAQISLKRQPVNDVEINAGDWMKVNPEAFTNCYGYVEHETLFTFNPSLIPVRVIDTVLNDRNNTMLERGVTDLLLANGYKFGVFGHTDDAPRVTHTGIGRANGWRL